MEADVISNKTQKTVLIALSVLLITISALLIGSHLKTQRNIKINNDIFKLHQIFLKNDSEYNAKLTEINEAKKNIRTLSSEIYVKNIHHELGEHHSGYPRYFIKNNGSSPLVEFTVRLGITSWKMHRSVNKYTFWEKDETYTPNPILYMGQEFSYAGESTVDGMRTFQVLINAKYQNGTEEISKDLRDSMIAGMGNDLEKISRKLKEKAETEIRAKY